MSLGDEVASILELLLQLLECVLLGHGEVSQPPGGGLVVGVRDAVGHGARACLFGAHRRCRCRPSLEFGVYLGLRMCLCVYRRSCAV